jgi:TP901 family phage tail tape measure protein
MFLANYKDSIGIKVKLIDDDLDDIRDQFDNFLDELQKKADNKPLKVIFDKDIINSVISQLKDIEKITEKIGADGLTESLKEAVKITTELKDKLSDSELTYKQKQGQNERKRAEQDANEQNRLNRVELESKLRTNEEIERSNKELFDKMDESRQRQTELAREQAEEEAKISNRLIDEQYNAKLQQQKNDEEFINASSQLKQKAMEDEREKAKEDAKLNNKILEEQYNTKLQQQKNDEEFINTASALKQKASQEERKRAKEEAEQHNRMLQKQYEEKIAQQDKEERLAEQQLQYTQRVNRAIDAEREKNTQNELKRLDIIKAKKDKFEYEADNLYKNDILPKDKIQEFEQYFNMLDGKSTARDIQSVQIELKKLKDLESELSEQHNKRLTDSKAVFNEMLDQEEKEEKTLKETQKIRQAIAKHQEKTANKEQSVLYREAEASLKRQYDLKTKLLKAEGEQKVAIKQQLDQQEILTNELREQLSVENKVKLNKKEGILDSNYQITSKGDGLGSAIKSAFGEFAQWAIVAKGVQLVTNQIREGITFVNELNKSLTEIAIVTGRTQDETKKLAKDYNDLAKQMSVTTQEIANASVEFYRQGLSDQQVMERLQATTKYAKISNMDFNESAKILTATVNSMGIEIGKASDIFAYIGDATASGADEVGRSIQKMGGTADALNIPLEKAASWVGTLSAKTREGAEEIGNSLKAIMARYQQLRERGFSEEDGMAVNQVAKALGEVNIQIMDSEGNFRNFATVMDELGAKWESLSNREQAYIATSFAG